MDLPGHIWEVIASHLTGSDGDLRSLRQACSATRSVIPLPPHPTVKKLREFLCQRNCCNMFLLSTGWNHTTVRVVRERDNRDPGVSFKVTFWIEHRLLAIHRFTCGGMEYFGRMRWSEIVPNRRNLAAVNRAVNLYTGTKPPQLMFLSRDI